MITCECPVCKTVYRLPEDINPRLFRCPMCRPEEPAEEEPVTLPASHSVPGILSIVLAAVAFLLFVFSNAAYKSWRNSPDVRPFLSLVGTPAQDVIPRLNEARVAIHIGEASALVAVCGCLLAGLSFLSGAKPEKPHTKIAGLVANGVLLFWMLLVNGLLF